MFVTLVIEDKYGVSGIGQVQTVGHSSSRVYLFQYMSSVDLGTYTYERDDGMSRSWIDHIIMLPVLLLLGV